jgi:uncharacterized protein with HEPN domain
MDDQALISLMINDCEVITDYMEGMTKDSFRGLHADAVARRLAGLGEKAKLLSDSFVKSHPSLPVSSMAKMRDRISHHYEGISEDIVFEIALNDVPMVLKELRGSINQR